MAGKVTAGPVGSALARRFLAAETGEVMGVYGAACYFRFPDGEVGMLCDRACGTISFAVGVPDCRRLLAGISLTPGMAVRLTPVGLHVPKAEWFLPLMSGALTPLPPRPMPVLVPPQALARSLARGEALLWAHPRGVLKALLNLSPGLFGDAGIPPETANIYSRTAWQPLSLLWDGYLAANEAAVSAALERLLGLGPGLTPSMDDFLCGLFAMLHRLEQAGASSGAVGLLSAALYEAAARRTSAISAAYVRATVTCGELEPLWDAADALLTGAEPQPLARLAAVGGSSGADMLTGLLCAGKWILPQYNVGINA